MILGKLREPEKEVNMKFLNDRYAKVYSYKGYDICTLSVLAQQRGMAWGM